MDDKIMVWLAVAASILALGKQGWDLIASRKKDQIAIDDALQKQPLVMEQLQLGNVGKAVEYLNQAMAGQASVITQQAARLEALEQDKAQVEAERSEWHSKYLEEAASVHSLRAEVAQLRAEVERLRNAH